MFISQTTSTSGFGELQFLKDVLTSVGATKDGDRFSGMTGQTGTLSTSLEFVDVHKTIHRLSPLGVHVTLQFNEFHLVIGKTVLHCQIKWMS